MKATSTGKLLDSLPRNDAVVELYIGEFNVAYCRDPEWKLPTPSPIFSANSAHFHIEFIYA
jgi:hypothetical protein